MSYSSPAMHSRSAVMRLIAPSPLRQGRADEVGNEAVGVGVLATRIPFKQTQDLVRDLPEMCGNLVRG